MKRKYTKPIVILLTAVLAMCLVLTACTDKSSDNASSAASGSEAPKGSAGLLSAPKIKGLTLEDTLEKEYATEFDVFYYSDGYKVVSVSDGRQYLVVPEGKDAPEELDEDISVLYAPLNRAYLAATSAMSLILAIGAEGNIRMTGTDTGGWHISGVKELIESGQILYAGKYSEPDYEMLIDEDCNLAIESTMILHSPKVQEMIEKMDIPVFIDRSSYEGHPLGRTEWIKVYGALFDKEEEAKTVFASKSQIIEDLKDFPNTEKKVAYFNVKTDGTVQIRSPKDYVATMIDLGGARYAFADIKTNADSASTISISMEEFYATAIDADYLIYNATIAAPIETVDDLIALDGLFRDYKAVKEGNVWCSGNNMYQATDIVGEFILDINNMVTGGSEENMTFLRKVN